MDIVPGETGTHRRTMRDLVALTALPAVWAGYRPPQVAEGLADVLLTILRLDLVYVRLPAPIEGGQEIEVARTGGCPATPDQARDVGRALTPWLEAGSGDPAPSIANLAGSGTVRLLVFPIVYDRQDGALVVGSRQTGFPSEEDRVLLGVAANQAAAVLQQQRAAAALRESEERFRGTFENAAVGITHNDSAGRFLRVNGTYCAIVGYPREELLQRTFQDITHPEDRAGNVELYRALLRGDSPILGLQKRYVRKDGSKVWVELSASLQRDAAGQPAYVIAVAQDISERKRLDGELRQAKEAEAERARLAELGRDVGIALSQGDTLRELLQPCAEAIVRYLDAAFARVWWLPPGSDVLELQASAGVYIHLDGPHARIPVGRLTIGRIAQERRPVLTNEVQVDPCISDSEWARREGMVSFAGFPLVVNDRLL